MPLHRGASARWLRFFCGAWQRPPGCCERVRCRCLPSAPFFATRSRRPTPSSPGPRASNWSSRSASRPTTISRWSWSGFTPPLEPPSISSGTRVAGCDYFVFEGELQEHLRQLVRRSSAFEVLTPEEVFGSTPQRPAARAQRMIHAGLMFEDDVGRLRQRPALGRASRSGARGPRRRDPRRGLLPAAALDPGAARDGGGRGGAPRFGSWRCTSRPSWRFASPGEAGDATRRLRVQPRPTPLSAGRPLVDEAIVEAAVAV